MRKQIPAACLVACLAVLGSSAPVRGGEVTVGYQPIYNPWKAAIVDGTFERATGYRIHWRKFDSGRAAIHAMASGEVQVALAGSSPIAAGVSRNLPIQLFWIAEDIAASEALVVRNGAGIHAPQDLRGKRLGVPFGSTTHFHALFALEQFGIPPKGVRILDMQPPGIAAAWERGDIDAAFVWNPVLAQIKKSGKVLITSGLLSGWGKATFDGMIVHKKFGAAHPGFMCRFIQVLAAAHARYRSNPESFGPGTASARRIADFIGGAPDDVRAALDLYVFPTLEEQASARWMGGAAHTLRSTAEFLLGQKKIRQLLPDYGAAVNDAHVKAALAGCRA